MMGLDIPSFRRFQQGRNILAGWVIPLGWIRLVDELSRLGPLRCVGISSRIGRNTL